MLHILKPANIPVTKQGLKVPDFGLAKQNSVGLGPDEAVIGNPASGEIRYKRWSGGAWVTR